MKKYLPSLPLVILLAGAILRAAGLTAAAIWHDEAVTFYRVTEFSLFSPALARNFSEQSGDLLLELILRLLLPFSRSVWMLRMPSLLASFGCLGLTWLIVRKLQFSLLQQTLVAALVAFLPGMLWMAQDARSYSLLTLCLLAGLYFALQGRWLGMTACLGLSLYCHNIAVAFVAPIWIMLAEKQRGKALLSAAILAIAFLPQTAYAWINNLSGPSLAPDVLTWGRASWSIYLGFWGGSLDALAGVFFIFLLIGSIPLVFNKRFNKTYGFLLTAWTVPVIFLLGVSLSMSNILIYRTIQPIIWFFLVWLGGRLFPKEHSSLSIRHWKLWSCDMLIGFWLGFLLLGLLSWNPATRGGNLDKIAAEIRAEWQPGDVLVYSTQTVAVPFDFYMHDLPHVYLEDAASSFFLNPPGTKLIQSTGTMQGASREWVLVPDDVLLTPAEWAALMDLVDHRQPCFSVDYLQSSAIKVYQVTK